MRIRRYKQTLITMFAILSLLSIPEPASSFGLADWRDTTPGGNTINRAGMTALWLSDGSEIEPLCCWYFYRDSIIGRLTNEASNGYFVVNENDLSIQRFESEQEWDAYLKSNDLLPVFWTRWHSYKWSTSIDDVLMLLAFGFMFAIPLLILFGVIFFKAAFKEKLNMRKINSRILVLSLALSGFYLLLGIFPQSF